MAILTTEAARIPNFPPEATETFAALCEEPLADFNALKAACLERVRAFEAAAECNEFVSVADARRVAALCVRLIDGLGEAASDFSRRLVWATARYFIRSHDADYDFDIAGLDDDIAVANAVACYLGHPDWCIPP